MIVAEPFVGEEEGVTKVVEALVVGLMVLNRGPFLLEKDAGG